MSTVNDAARITTRDGTVWRTCTGCGLLAALPADTDTCPGCDRPAVAEPRRVPDVWDLVNAYAETVGRIQAWTDMAHRSDAERLDKIREFLADLDRFQTARREEARRCR